MPWEYDEAKAKELILYIAQQTESDETTGATKLDKIPYFAEVAHLRQYGRPIVGADYQKQPMGPTLRRMLPIMQQLEEEGAARRVDRDYFGQRQIRLFALRRPDLSPFSAEEIASVDAVIRQAWGQTASAISDHSHEDPGWRSVQDGESIPMTLAFISKPSISDDIRGMAHKLAAEVGAR